MRTITQYGELTHGQELTMTNKVKFVRAYLSFHNPTFDGMIILLILPINFTSLDKEIYM